ncbi:MAG TPA: formate dehydrogenase accessory protein FdhE [Terriglobales bacterium]|nr:formate dehydrogenase accessory protein FdhE [Terriglobales bacterium]
MNAFASTTGDNSTVPFSAPYFTGLFNPRLIDPITSSLDNQPMRASPWQRRIKRAEYLANQYSFAAEILRFYAGIARFQEDLYGRLEAEAENLPSAQYPSGPPELQALINGFSPFLSAVEKNGPARLAEIARELRGSSRESWSQLLDESWSTTESANAAEEFLARAFLQPYAELLRLRGGITFEDYNHSLCPFCSRKAGLGVLRQQGDGGRRSLVCSFCLAEWEFRRILCPGCGEENNSKLPVYTASDFDYVRVECCDTCKTYIKSVDLTRNGLAEPMIDEMAAAPLDVWAQQHGYSKLQLNLLGM